MKIQGSDEDSYVRGLEFFLSIESESSPTPEALSCIARKNEKDLVSSSVVIGAKYTAMTGLGLIISLFICAQGGVGLGTFSFRTYEFMMDVISPSWCGATCGFLFSSVPFLLCLFVFNRFEQRYLLFRMAWLVALLPLAAAAGLLFYGNHMQGSEGSFWNWASSWTLFAVVTPYAFEAIIYVTSLRRKRPALT